jgi:RNA polymerase sigma factor (sigma-70 family)
MSRSLSTLLLHLRRSPLVLPGHVSDAELLRRFVSQQDAAAFELLFWRHGPMVWAVCRRILGSFADAEDAFQAAFVVLARKARSIGDGAALAAWLHRVAWRTALTALRSRSRRAAHEQLCDSIPEVIDPNDSGRSAVDSELKGVIDRELMRLPTKFRLPVLLCDVEGRSHESAAAELKCPLGTLNSRWHAVAKNSKVACSSAGFVQPCSLQPPCPRACRLPHCGAFPMCLRLLCSRLRQQLVAR